MLSSLSILTLQQQQLDAGGSCYSTCSGGGKQGGKLKVFYYSVELLSGIILEEKRTQ